MGLRLKLGLYVVGFVFLVLILAGLLQVRSERQIYLEEMQRRSITLMRSLAIPCATAIANDDIATLDNYVEQFADAALSLDLRYIAVLDGDGRVLAHTASGEFGKVYNDPLTHAAMNSAEPVSRLEEAGPEPILEVAVPASISDLRWGTVEAGFSVGPVERTIAESQRRTLVTGGVVSLAVAAAVFLVLSFLVLRPVTAMERMARRFGGGDLDARVTPRSGDEMGNLALQLNGMAQQIQGYTDSLERLVRERTSELADANARLVEANRQLDRLAKTDPLTGLYNRRYFMEQLEFEIRRGARMQRQFSLAILDVDFFKQYNDANGHTAGDELLQRLATLLELNLRSVDLVARYGGEEFIVLLLDTGPEEGYATAHKLQQVVAAQPFPFEETQPNGKLTVSLGVAFYPRDAIDPRRLIEQADEALYFAKDSGRNVVKRWDDVIKS